MARDREPSSEHADLAAYLAALANPSRLELLSLLRTPRAVREIALRPTGPVGPEGLRADRNISDQGVRKHLARLEDAGLVVSRSGRRAGVPVEERIVNHQALFAILEQLRELVRLAPTVPLAPAATMTEDGRPAAHAGEGPRLVVVHGHAEGTTFPLVPATAPDGAWRIGRRPGLAVCLDYDPYVSQEHAAVARAADGFEVRDLPRSKNGTRLNWRPLPRGGAARLVTGDVVGVGKSLLLFRADRGP